VSSAESPGIPAPGESSADPWADYRVGDAWRRALVYLAVCLILGAVSGALGAGLTQPWGEDAKDSGWALWTAACVLVVFVGYWVIWPMGTLTHGRPLVPSSTVFGVLWGVAEGTLFAAVWYAADAGLDRWFESPWPAICVAFVVLSAYLGLWHQFYWDLKVSPDHNIEEWNLRKVLLVHVPNLAVTLPYLAFTDAVAIFIALQTLGLVGSARAMHFPGFPGLAAVLGRS
jgi:hypothetical protein